MNRKEWGGNEARKEDMSPYVELVDVDLKSAM